jgi:hypothetical protein
MLSLLLSLLLMLLLQLSQSQDRKSMEEEVNSAAGETHVLA